MDQSYCIATAAKSKETRITDKCLIPTFVTEAVYQKWGLNFYQLSLSVCFLAFCAVQEIDPYSLFKFLISSLFAFYSIIAICPCLPGAYLLR